MTTLRSRMAPTDALFWYAEAALPIFRPIIAGLYVLRETPARESVDATLRRMVRAVPRLRQRVLDAPLHLTMPEWIEDAHFDFEYHVRHLSLSAPGTMRVLLELAGALLATPLDRERPLWEAYCIDGLENGRSAFFMKLHHCLVDGVGSMAILDGLTRAPALNGQRHAQPAPRTSLGARALRAARSSARSWLRATKSVASLPVAFATHPIETGSQALAAARGLAGMVADARKPLIRDPLARNSSGLSRRLDVASISIARLREIKEPWGITLNDVVLTALAGCLGAYYRERGVRMTALNCMVPMNLRSSGERDALGNRVGVLNVSLPLCEMRIERRVRAIVDQTRAAKRDKRGALFPVLMEALPLVPGAAFAWLARHSLGRINVACTNVPGVRETRSMAGVEIEAIYPFASVVEGTPVVIALLSYGERLEIGLDTDAEAIPHPHRITELFEAALDELAAAAAKTHDATRPGAGL